MRKGVALALALMLLCAAGVGLYWAGYRASGTASTHVREELSQLSSQVDYLQKRNQELLDKNAQLGRAGEIDREAMRRVQTMLNQMQGKLADLTEEVSFYRSIVSPSKLKPGLHLQRFEVNAGAAKREYRYHLVLTQAQDKHKVVKGRVDVQIVGRSGAQTKTLDMGKLAGNGLDFSFRYFHDFSGSFTLPEGFVPQRVEIKVTPFTRRVAGVTQTVTWKQAMTGEG
ncbi:hypothetical protein Thpro_022834 [Acidihalobacter prosperus]|uniref:Uncharacterized protein n=1 Tax=Acidihalobacter prosperus TaxID=160660 RepID=A0A1A6C208_9GAMM|nr:hypothetical protein Thpro_022834 [Acidihalobacter prosperus]